MEGIIASSQARCAPPPPTTAAPPRTAAPPGRCDRPFTPPSPPSPPPPSSQASERIVGLGEQRFGRRSLKSELMSQILAGVHTQMVNMKEEEILVKIGEREASVRHGARLGHTLGAPHTRPHASHPAPPPLYSATPEINKQARDESIEAFVNKRRTTSTSSANLLGGFDSSSRAGSLAESKESSPRRKKGGGLRGNRSAPQLFGGASRAAAAAAPRLRVAHADQFGRRPRARPRRLVPPQDRLRRRRPWRRRRTSVRRRRRGGGRRARARRRRPLCGGDSAAAARAAAREGPDRRAQGDGAVAGRLGLMGVG